MTAVLWPVFLALGWEQVRIDPGNTAVTPLDFVSYPISHSLLTACGWGVLFALVYWLVSHYVRGAVVIALGVISHWLLDFVTHRPDMPLYPGGPRVGLGLWNSIAGTLAVELAMYAAGIWLYVSMTRARDRTGRLSLLAFLAVSLLLYAGAMFGSPPPNTHVLMLTSFVGWVVPIWAWGFDRHREILG